MAATMLQQYLPLMRLQSSTSKGMTTGTCSSSGGRERSEDEHSGGKGSSCSLLPKEEHDAVTVIAEVSGVEWCSNSLTLKPLMHGFVVVGGMGAVSFGYLVGLSFPCRCCRCRRYRYSLRYSQW
jgi:hypothetical protein